jgi:hypothetical protein
MIDGRWCSYDSTSSSDCSSKPSSAEPGNINAFAAYKASRT